MVTKRDQLWLEVVLKQDQELGWCREQSSPKRGLCYIDTSEPIPRAV